MCFQNTIVGQDKTDIPNLQVRHRTEGRGDRSQANPKPNKTRLESKSSLTWCSALWGRGHAFQTYWDGDSAFWTHIPVPMALLGTAHAASLLVWKHRPVVLLVWVCGGRPTPGQGSSPHGLGVTTPTDSAVVFQSVET